MSKIKILLAKGELGSFIQKYLEEKYKIKTTVGERKPELIAERGEFLIRAVRSPDVCRYFKKLNADFGITGLDLVYDTKLQGDNSFKILKKLDRESPSELKGRLCLLGKENLGKEREPIVCVSEYYKNIAKTYFDSKKRRLIDSYELLPVFGGVEGYIASDEADFGIDTVYSRKTLNKINEYIRKKNKKQIKILDNIMLTYPVIISKPEYSFDEFESILEKQFLLWTLQKL